MMNHYHTSHYMHSNFERNDIPLSHRAQQVISASVLQLSYSSGAFLLPVAQVSTTQKKRIKKLKHVSTDVNVKHLQKRNPHAQDFAFFLLHNLDDKDVN